MRSRPELAGERVRVALVAGADAAALLAFHTRNRDHLKPWMPPLPADFYRPRYWRLWAAEARPLFDQDRAVRLAIRPDGGADGAIIGQINLSNIVRGPLQACHLGYHIDRDAEGGGLMHEAMQLVTAWAFGRMGLHRLMANYQPGNARSAGLLEHLGFEVEGFAKAYLFIDGAWRDHVLTALTNPDPTPPPASTATTAGRRPA